MLREINKIKNRKVAFCSINSSHHIRWQMEIPKIILAVRTDPFGMVGYAAPKRALSVNSEHRNLQPKIKWFEFEISYHGKEDSNASWKSLRKYWQLIHSSESIARFIFISLERTSQKSDPMRRVLRQTSRLCSRALFMSNVLSLFDKPTSTPAVFFFFHVLASLIFCVCPFSYL